jgi:cyanate permease
LYSAAGGLYCAFALQPAADPAGEKSGETGENPDNIKKTAFMKKNDPSHAENIMVNNPDQTAIFFGWWTVLVTGIVSGLGLGFYVYGISALFKPIASDLGLSRAATSGGSGVGAMVGYLLAPLIGWTADRFGPRSAIAGGLLTVITGLIMMNFVNSIHGFYLVWGLVIGVGANLGLTIAIDKALANWFVKKIGLAMGVKFALIGLFSALSMPLVSWLITRFGWRMTCLIWAALLLIGVPFVIALIKNERPEFFGLLPDGEKNGTHLKMESGVRWARAAADAADLQASEFGLRDALRTGSYWILTLCLFTQSFIMTGFNTHFIPFLTEMNIAPVVAGSMMGIMLFFSIPSRFFGGLFADRVGKDRMKILLALPFAFIILGMAAFLIHPSIETIYLLMFFYGLAHGLPTPLILVSISRYFGRKAFGAICGTAVMCMSPAAFISPVLAGWIFDSTGSYSVAFVVFASISLVVIIALGFLKVPVKKNRSLFP